MITSEAYRPTQLVFTNKYFNFIKLKVSFSDFDTALHTCVRVLLVSHDGNCPCDMVARVQNQKPTPVADHDPQGQQNVLLLCQLDRWAPIRHVALRILNGLKFILI